ncbi:MAG: hypothetical protein IPJ76_04985 [Flavobacteriales bacterium]|nr:MAG: hypothetical protein IPJ76_04985 [Flavobacteriales bacterium]
MTKKESPSFFKKYLFVWFLVVLIGLLSAAQMIHDHYTLKPGVLWTCECTVLGNSGGFLRQPSTTKLRCESQDSTFVTWAHRSGSYPVGSRWIIEFDKRWPARRSYVRELN